MEIKMLFHKHIYVLIKILFIFISITMITAVGKDQEAGPSGSESSGYFTAPESPNYFTAIEGEADEKMKSSESSGYFTVPESSEYFTAIKSESDGEIKSYNSCWEALRSFTNTDKPEAIDFAKTAMARWRRGDLDHKVEMKIYFHIVYGYLNAEDIEPPNTYCQNFDYENASKWSGGVKQCQFILERFGATNHKALKNGYYEYNVPYLMGFTDSETLNKATEVFREDADYTKCYMIHMIQNMKVFPGIISPLKFCKKYEEDEKFRQNVHRDYFFIKL